MPKKDAGGASSKKPPTPARDDEGSYIVFGDEQPKKTKATNAHQAQDLESQGAAKKPDARQVIGGASWTGKLPVNMLSEHCQKQKWEKPEYTMVLDPTPRELAWTLAKNLAAEQILPGFLIYCDLEVYEPKDSRDYDLTTIHIASLGQRYCLL